MKRWDYTYPEIPNLLTMKPTPRVLLGQRLYWTYKHDGSNICIYLENEEIKISSRHMKDASEDLISLVKRTDDYKKVLELLYENPQFAIYVEACKKGRGVTGMEIYERDTLFLFDIYDREEELFLPYVLVYQHGFHHNIPVVELYAETRHRSMKDLLKFKNNALEHCEAIKIEGMVIKAYKIPEQISNWRELKGGLLQAKVKLDIPEPKIKKIKKGEPIYPSIPEIDIMGAINRAWEELGTEGFKDVGKAMPLIAQFVGEECKKHLYNSPTQKLFTYYQKYLEERIK